MSGYKILNNPDLTPESSSGFEGGLRYASEKMFVNLAWYQTDYEDFIEENSYAGFDPMDGFMMFQTINVGEATIDGWEVSARMTLSHLFNSVGTSDADWMDNFKVRFALASASGRDTVSNEPLDSVEPLNGCLLYTSPSPRD